MALRTQRNEPSTALEDCCGPDISEGGTVRFSVFNARANRNILNCYVFQLERERKYNQELERLLREHDIQVPEEILAQRDGVFTPAQYDGSRNGVLAKQKTTAPILEDGSISELRHSMAQTAGMVHKHTVEVQYRELTFWNMVAKKHIRTVGSALTGLLLPGWLTGRSQKERVEVLSGLTGRIPHHKMTLVMGPPGSGKSTFLKALSGKLYVGSAHLEGDILYNGDRLDSGRFLPAKVADYVDEKDIHAATLTVRETLEFAWRLTTGGRHSYGRAKDAESAALLDRDNLHLVKVRNVTTVLGLQGSANTVVGDGMLRGVSGGQKRRVTLGEMVLPPRVIKYMDAISNGLDASTTYDIMRAVKLTVELFGITAVVSLLQPAPEVFNLFDELILFSEGQIIYQGPMQQVVPYFEGLGYKCPDTMDVADFLQELPTPEGRRFIVPGRKPVSTYNLPSLQVEAYDNDTTTDFVNDEKQAIGGEKQRRQAVISEGKDDNKEASAIRCDRIRDDNGGNNNNQEGDCVVVDVDEGKVKGEGQGEGESGDRAGHNDVEQLAGDMASREDLHLLDRSHSSIAIDPVEHLDPISSTVAPRGTTALAQAWKHSAQFQHMLHEMDRARARGGKQEHDGTGNKWPAVLLEPFAGSYWFSLWHVMVRQVKVTVRDLAFLKGRLMQALIIGAIAGSLFSNIERTDTQTLSGVLYFCCLNSSLSNISLIPQAFGHRAVFYKHSAANFFPTSVYVICRTVVLYPLFIVENVVFSLIVYWSVGLTADDNGARYITFIIVLLCITLTASQLFTFITTFMPASVTATPLAGVFCMIMILFSGYIIPRENIPDGAIWLYYLNPVGYALQAMLINELTSSDYDFDTCTRFDEVTDECIRKERFGDVALNAYGYETAPAWIWWGVFIMLGQYLVLVLLTGVGLTYLRVEPTPPAPVFVDDAAVEAAALAAEAATAAAVAESSSGKPVAGPGAAGSVEIPFEPVNFAFRDVWYTVTLKGGEELDLLRGISGYFEPGTLTALMGSSGAGKTTLLDVLSGRKTTGVIKGDMMVNGKSKDENLFQHIMGYVEQFDTLSPHDTAREAIEFSAAMRLPRGTSREARADWVNNVLDMLELMPLEHTMVGSAEAGGMSFEQKKRVSIGVELAANPAILFLDEPTTGLDSRAAQVVVRCIRRVASSGRSIVCTIHQPSSYIFAAFDSLLLLRRGGQTVFFGELGEQCQNLVSFFQQVPGVQPMAPRQNPASWMLDVIGAGTSGGQSSGAKAGEGDGNHNPSVITTDFHAFYLASALCDANASHMDVLFTTADPASGSSSTGSDFNHPICQSATATATHRFNATYVEQFRFLMYRFMLTYWRSPSYNFIRMVISVIIALIFSAMYANQHYETDIDVISRAALMYITTLFAGIVAMMTVQSVIFSERPAFYREKNSNLYDVMLYALAAMLVEVPYLVVSSVLFVIPFFFIVGFDKDGTASKFFWYWLFLSLYTTTLVFLGHFYASVLPNEATAQVITGMTSTLISLFSGFMIRAQDMPTFWQFMYWLDPLHYAVEGLFTTQFNRDDTSIELRDGTTTTTQAFVTDFYSEWDYRHRVADVVALLIFIAVFRVATYLALEYVRHDKR